MIDFERITDHVDRGLLRRAGPFTSEGFALLMRPLLEEVQEIETAVWDLVDAGNVDLATGYWLARLGARVDEAALGDSDDDYRLRIVLKLRAARSNGEPEDLIDLVRLSSPDANWSLTEAPGWALITHAADALAFDPGQLARILNLAASGGFNVALIAPASGEESETLMMFGDEDGDVEGAEWPSSDGSDILGSSWAGQW